MHSLLIVSERINNAIKAYDVGKLQFLRQKLKGLERLPSKVVFDARAVTSTWAHHYGGRSELQFNIGIEGDDLRYGVAFSLEPSRSYPDIRHLVSKIRLFNEYLLEFSSEYSDLRMWHYRVDTDNGPCEPLCPRPIESSWVKEKVFIFLGTKQPLAMLDYDEIAVVLNRLLPLYLHIEQASTTNVIQKNEPTFQFTPGLTKKASSATSSMFEKELSIELLHNDLQETLYNRLVQQYGEENVGTENSVGFGRVDLVVKRSDALWLYEIKTASTAKACIRQALGQIMEYAYYSQDLAPEKLIIAGPGIPTISDHKYLELLKNKFSLPIEYLPIKDIDKGY